MRDQRLTALALASSALAGLVTMAFHPDGHEVLAAQAGGAVVARNAAVHTLAIVTAPVAFLGGLGLLAMLRASGRLALVALVFFGLAEIAVTSAALMSGYVTPALMRQSIHPVLGDATTWRVLSLVGGLLNQAYSKVFVICSGMAIALWSVAMLRERAFPRALGIYGVVIGAVMFGAAVANAVPFTVHGFGAVVLLQAVWSVCTAASLWNDPPATAEALPATGRSAAP